jgi:hypothetical protein
VSTQRFYNVAVELRMRRSFFFHDLQRF